MNEFLDRLTRRSNRRGYSISESKDWQEAVSQIAAKDATIAELTEKLERTERNRDMWKGQVERQSAKISNMREALAQIAAHEPRTDHNGNLNDLIAVRSVETAHNAPEASKP